MTNQASKSKAPFPLTALLLALDPVVRKSVKRRFEAMNREFDYLRDSKVDDFAFLAGRGWSVEKFRVLFMLNSVYQLAIGPLSSSARSTVGLGDKVPIVHGSDVFDRTRARSVNRMVMSFKQVVLDLSLRTDWLVRNTAGDIVHKITQFERELAEFSDG